MNLHSTLLYLFLATGNAYGAAKAPLLELSVLPSPGPLAPLDHAANAIAAASSVVYQLDALQLYGNIAPIAADVKAAVSTMASEALKAVLEIDSLIPDARSAHGFLSMSAALADTLDKLLEVEDIYNDEAIRIEIARLASAHSLGVDVLSGLKGDWQATLSLHAKRLVHALDRAASQPVREPSNRINLHSGHRKLAKRSSRDRTQTYIVGAVWGCLALGLIFIVAGFIRRHRIHRRNMRAATETPAVVRDHPWQHLEQPAATRDYLLGTCRQCGSDVRSRADSVTCCGQIFHKACVGPDTECLGTSPCCIGKPVLPLYEKPPTYSEIGR